MFHRENAVLVTGSSTGIGRDAVYEFADLGYHVFAAVRKQSDFAPLLAGLLMSLC